MTAYIRRIRGLTGGEPSLRVRPRSRFEPAPPGTEPPWEATVPRRAPQHAETGDADPAGSWAETLWPAADDPKRAARLQSGLTPGRSPAWLASSPAPGSPGPVAPSAGARRTPSQLRPDAPPGPSGRPGPAWAAAADRAETGAQDARSARPAPDGHLAHRDDRRWPPGGTSPSLLDPASESTESVPAPARSGRGRMGSAPGDRSGAGSARPAAPARRADSASPAESIEPALALSGDRLRVMGRPPRSELVGPYLGRISGPDGLGPAGSGLGGRVGGADPLADDPGGASRPERLDPGRYPAAGRTQPDEVTVTIGRVEVRVSPAPVASGSAAPPAVPPSPRPQPSRLEDYLRARTAGRVG
jgi:hypothetical protein